MHREESSAVGNPYVACEGVYVQALKPGDDDGEPVALHGQSVYVNHEKKTWLGYDGNGTHPEGRPVALVWWGQLGSRL